jgi:uncharacterized protein with HEPN domain
MSEPKELVRLRHMQDYAREALELIKGKGRSNLDSERLLELALVRLLEMVGEAANRVSPEYQSLHPLIPWSQIIGLRNRLIHGYDTVDKDILWHILERDLPILTKELEKILSKKPES